MIIYKKQWITPKIISLNSNSIASGTIAIGVEKILTCGGNISTPTVSNAIVASTNCTSQNPDGNYVCTGISNSPSQIGIGQSYIDATIAQACS